jgi:predicted secreted protein
MGIFSAIVVYVLIWWIVMFCVLPMNIQHPDKNTGGSMPGAPVHPGLKRKLILTTAISCAVWVIVYFLIKADFISYHDIAQRMAM